MTNIEKEFGFLETTECPPCTRSVKAAIEEIKETICYSFVDESIKFLDKFWLHANAYLAIFVFFFAVLKFVLNIYKKVERRKDKQEDDGIENITTSQTDVPNNRSIDEVNQHRQTDV